MIGCLLYCLEDFQLAVCYGCEGPRGDVGEVAAFALEQAAGFGELQVESVIAVYEGAASASDEFLCSEAFGVCKFEEPVLGVAGGPCDIALCGC